MARRKPKNQDERKFRDNGRSTGPERDTGDSKPAAAPAGNNDISWYTRYPNLLLAAGSFPYPNRPGMSIDLGTARWGALANPTDVPISYKVPGVLVLDWIPTVGNSSLSTDPASILGKEIYARVRNAYSGTLRADAPDYVIYILALDSIYSYISWLKRLFRVMNTWTPENYNVPDALLHGMGLTDADIQELRLHRVELWQAINTLVLQSRKFTCPASIDYIHRHYWLNDNVFTDSPSMASQFYMFNQIEYYQYALAKYVEGGSMVGGVETRPPMTIRSSTTSDNYKLVTVDHLLSMGLDMINALNEWDDAYTINGYLTRAFAGDPGFVVDEIALDARFEPIFNPEVLIQIENSQCSVAPQYWLENVSHLSVYQDPSTNAIISKPRVEYTTLDGDAMMVPGVEAFFNMRIPNPTALENTIASRLKVCVQLTEETVAGETNPVKMLSVISCGSEIPVGWRLVGANSSDWTGNAASVQAEMSKEYIDQYMYFTGGSLSSKMKDVMNALRLEAFDWHPFLVLTWITGTSASALESDSVLIGDVSNITMVTQEQLAELHKICLYSEFNSFGMI